MSIRIKLPLLQELRFSSLEPIRLETMLKKHNVNYAPKGASLSRIKKKVEIQKYCEPKKSRQRKRFHSIFNTEPNCAVSVEKSRHYLSISQEEEERLVNGGKFQLLSLRRSEDGKPRNLRTSLWLLEKPKLSIINRLKI